MHAPADAIRHVSPCAGGRIAGDHDSRRRLVFEIRPANSSEVEALALGGSTVLAVRSPLLLLLYKRGGMADLFLYLVYLEQPIAALDS